MCQNQARKINVAIVAMNCRACGKLNHFVKVCRNSKSPSKYSKKGSKESVRVAKQTGKSPSNSSDDEYTFAVLSSKITNVQVQINGTPNRPDY